MSAIARLLLAKGKCVSGSDQSDSEIMQELAGLGARTYVGHQASNVTEAGVVVISTAITQANPELAYAREKNIPVLHRSDILRLLSNSYKLIAVSGTHGKTTTTGMVSQVLMEGGKDPSVVVGGIFNKIGSNSRFGRGEYFVAEADESDRTHENVTSYISILTNIEPDHLENYPGGLAQIKDVMTAFANKSSRAVVLCQDDPGCVSVMSAITAAKITYGKKASGTVPANYEYEPVDAARMRVFHNGTLLGEMQVAVPGDHNKQNALAALAVGLEVGVSFADAARALSEFGGVNRRFQILGEQSGIVVVDDYAHHPTEVLATLKAAREFLQRQKADGPRLHRVVALFQPHQPGRLRDLWQEFLHAFDDADVVLMADVYIARGQAIDGINSERLVEEMKHRNVHHIPGKADQLCDKVIPYLQAGDLVLTIGAGDVTRVGAQLLDGLAKRNG